jgi:hypothetical protein
VPPSAHGHMRFALAFVPPTGHEGGPTRPCSTKNKSGTSVAVYVS